MLTKFRSTPVIDTSLTIQNINGANSSLVVSVILQTLIQKESNLQHTLISSCRLGTPVILNKWRPVMADVELKMMQLVMQLDRNMVGISPV